MTKRTEKRADARDQSDFRALTLIDCLGPRHRTLLVSGDDSAPHLCAGEYAVIDTADRNLEHGELYLIQYSRSRSIVQAKRDYINITGPGADASLVWWVCALAGFRKTTEVLDGIPVFAGLSDGPYETDDLQRLLIGRIVGVAASALGGLLGQDFPKAVQS